MCLSIADTERSLMSLTLEDALLYTKSLYKIKLIAGKQGVSNQISWVHLLEDTTIINQFWGNELAVTTGFGFPNTKSLLILISQLKEHQCAGLIINTGKYIQDIPNEVYQYCEDNNFPLMTVPWEVYLADLIKDFCIRTFTSQKDEQQTIRILTTAIKKNVLKNTTLTDLAVSFDFSEPFYLFIISFPFIDHIDFMERHKIRFQMQTLLHKKPFTSLLFPYENCFVLILNGLKENNCSNFLTSIIHEMNIFLPNQKYFIGFSECFYDFTDFLTAYAHAAAALTMAEKEKKTYIDFNKMGMNYLLYAFTDKKLLGKLSANYLATLTEYDATHHSNYEETLRSYLKYDGSIQAIAEELFTHRNTIQYRMNKIKELLNCDFSNTDDKFNYMLAFKIKDSL